VIESIQNLCNLYLKYEFKNIRNLNHQNQKLEYFDDFFYVEEIDEIILHSIPFWFKKIFSHLILEFQFKDNKKIFLSVEARRQKGEWFKIWKWFFKHYGLIYIWWTEEDVIWLRRDVRKDKIFSYTLSLSEKWKKQWFKCFVNKTNNLLDTPKFYNVLNNNCVTNLWEVLKLKSSKKIQFSWEIIFSRFIVKYLEKYWYIK
jgi:hypothetical protein